MLELSAKDTKTLYYMPTGGVRRLTLSTVKDLESVRNFLATRSSNRMMDACFESTDPQKR